MYFLFLFFVYFSCLSCGTLHIFIYYHCWISLCEIVLDHFSITLCLSLYLYPIKHFFFSLSSSIVASCPKNRFLILVWADAVCLFWGYRKSILQNSRWLGSLSGQGFVNFFSHPPRLQFHKSSNSGQRSLSALLNPLFEAGERK